MSPQRPPATTLPITQAARFLGVHPNTLRAWADRGRIRCMRVNARGDRRFRVADLRAFLTAAEFAAAGRAQPDTRATGEPTTSRDSGDRVEVDREAQIDSIAKLGTRLNRLSSVTEIGQAICVELRQLIDYHNVRVYRVRGEHLEPVAWRGEIGEYTDEDGDKLRLRIGEGITGWVAEHGVAQYLPDAARDPRGTTMPGTESDLAESMLVAPMLYEDRSIGVIVLAKLGLDQFVHDDLRYLGIYAAIAAQAMVNADISERLRAQEETLERQLHSQRELLRITESILTNLDPSAVVEEMADSLEGLIPVDGLGIYVLEPGSDALSPVVTRGSDRDGLAAHGLSGAAGLAAEVLAGGEARSVHQGGPGGSALIMAPLRGRERMLGVLRLERVGAGARFEPKEFDLIRLFAAHVSIALQNALAHRAVEIRAQMDALTGLKNHGTFQEEVREAVARGERFALLMLDLDDFKAFNDRHGHEAGNELLRAIAGGIGSACRETDEVYRYGGDEFALILPRTDLSGALDVAERVRAAVRDASSREASSGQVPGSDVPGGDPSAARATRSGMRCSVGVALYPIDGATRSELVLAADRALYAAKRAGRDRVGTAAGGLATVPGILSRPTPVDDERPDQTSDPARRIASPA